MFWRGPKKSDKDRMNFVARRQKIGCQHIVKSLGITTEVIGQIPNDKAVLVASNHIGVFDSLILASNMDVAFVAKAEMGTWPIMGWVFRVVGIIFAHRKNVMKTAQTIEEIRTRMRSGVAVMVFPEGTTSDGTQLLPFKTGVFEAISHMSDGFVVPVYFHVRTMGGEKVDAETRKLVTWFAPQNMRSNLWQVLGLGPLHFAIRIGDPISSDGKNRKELAAESQVAVQVLKSAEEKSLGLSS